MRIPNAEHESHPWRIREIAPDFILEDVWALPVHGGAGDFDAVVANAISLDPADSDSVASRLLWVLRDLLGRWFGLGRISDGPESAGDESLARRLPADLRGTAAGLRFGGSPFVPLYRTADEFAAEISNRTVHGVMHLAWAPEGGDRYQGQMAVYVKPRGLLGTGYMALIRPFRHRIVYPALMRQIERTWDSRRGARP